ncbi:MAG: phosphonate ABC transporter ATP-binding protein [Alphaproteobacteria bacterium]|nr:phosphonate ABC transporter ATP-binding protein [Alphaproteobacteria bacterium]
MLSIKALTKIYGQVAAVDSVSFDVPAGQMVGIIGRSGAGKSTLLRMINRLTDASSGQVFFREGEETVDVGRLAGRKLLEWRGRCAMVFQQFNLVPRLPVLTNVMVGRLGQRATLPTLFGLFGEEDRALAIRALDRLDLVSHALYRADALSGGQQQRVAIARALVQEPRILLADEPIASLDLRNATIVMDALRRINREDGITVISNLHLLQTARDYCDRIIAMRKGAVVFDGKPAELTDALSREIYAVGAGSEEEVAMAFGATSAMPSH